MLLLCFAALQTVAAPAPDPTPASTLPVVSDLAGLNSALSALSAGPASAFPAGYTNLLSGIKPSATPTNNADAASRLAAVQSAYPSNVLAGAADLIMQGMTGGQAFSIGNPAAVSILKAGDMGRQIATDAHTQGRCRFWSLQQ